MTINTTAPLNPQHFPQALSLFKTARQAVYLNPPAETDEEERELDALVDAEDAACNYLMSHGAPDLAGVLAKIEIVAENPQINDAAEWLIGIGDDLMRLANISRSPTFDPFVWLHRFEMHGGKTGLIEVTGVRQGSLTVPLGDTRVLEYARDMVDGLAAHERVALDEYLLSTLNPGEHGLVAEGDAHTADGGTWTQRMIEWEEAVDAERQYFCVTYKPLWDEEKQQRAKTAEMPSPDGINALKAWGAASGWDAANEQIEALQSTIGRSKSALLNMPAPDSEALRWKLEILFDDEDDQNAKVIRSDVARLMGKGA